MIYDEKKKTLSWEEFLELGLIGNTAKRKKVCQAFHLGHCNAKTCFKRLNQAGISLEEVKGVLSHD